VSNVLSEEKKQQVIALGRLGWSLRKIQKTTGVRRETAADYLRAAGIGLRPPGAWGRSVPPKPANGVTPDPRVAKPASRADEVPPGSGVEPAAKPVSAPESRPGRRPSTSVCEPYQEIIELGLSKGRNAKGIWQDLVDIHGFTGDYQSVKRFVRRIRGQQSPEASRRYQNEVSIRLAGQVLRALNELVRGFQEADRSARGTILADALQHDPNHIYGGMLTTLMRMVFVLYAEDRSLMGSDETWLQNYSISGIFSIIAGTSKGERKRVQEPQPHG
jgi:hypothetical protein